ncbi:MAG: hypothetical protein ACTSRK_17925 [Promethearchaeota archaeon]
MTNCDICGNSMFDGFGIQSRQAARSGRNCKNCDTIRCNNCNLGYFCKNCIDGISEIELKEQIIALGKKSKTFNQFSNPMICIGVLLTAMISVHPIFLIIGGVWFLFLLIFGISDGMFKNKQKKLMKINGYIKKNGKFFDNDEIPKENLNEMSISSPENIQKIDQYMTKNRNALSFIPEVDLRRKFDELNGGNLPKSQKINKMRYWAWEKAQKEGNKITYGNLSRLIESMFDE